MTVQSLVYNDRMSSRRSSTRHSYHPTHHPHTYCSCAQDQSSLTVPNAVVRPWYEICSFTDCDKLIAVQLFMERSGHYMGRIPSLVEVLPRGGNAFAFFAILARLNASYCGILDLFS